MAFMLLPLGCFLSGQTSSDAIRLNSLGYTPEAKKTVTVVAPQCKGIVIKSVQDNKLVLKLKVEGPVKFPETDILCWIADFSELKKTGEYYIEVDGIGKSVHFKIDKNSYIFPWQTVTRSFYLMRCGCEVSGIFNSDTFSHKACHLNDAWLDYTGFGPVQADGIGGWHDAGDYGKYITNAGITLSNLFMAWDHFSNKFEKIPLDLPLTAPGMPEYLQELKWETDFFLKMQYPDNSGRIFHKLTRTHFEAFVLPEFDTAKRYFTEWSSDATAQFTAIMAMAARYFKPYDASYANICMETALRSYEFLKNNPDDKRWNQPEFHTGTYRTSDVHSRLWAAAELWETTGEEKYLLDFENRASAFEIKIDLNWDWGNIKNLGMFTYLLSKRTGKNQELFEMVKGELLKVADSLVVHSQNDAFGRPYDKYNWGCNGTVARHSLTLSTAYRLQNDKKYIDAAHTILAHLFGRNYYGRSFVTGLGVNPPLFPHDRRAGGDKVLAPWPGYLVGGGHTATDWVDKESSFSHNEIAINWQSPLVYLLAWLLPEPE